MAKPELIAIIIFALSMTSPMTALEESDCTLNPTEGVKRIRLDENIDAQMTWRSCHSMVKRIVFEWSPEMGVPDTPQAALSKAAAFASRWQTMTDEPISPFVGSVVTALENRTTWASPYQFGESIPVSDDALEVAGWDGVWVELSTSTTAVQLVVHYWANP